MEELPDYIQLKDVRNAGVTIETYDEISDPESYGLKLTKVTKNYDENPWYYPTIGILVVGIAFGSILLYLGVTEENKR